MQCTRRPLLIPIMCLADLLLISCAPAEPPDITVEPASRYTLFLEDNGMQVAIEPFLDRAQNELYFGTPMVDRNIIPLLIVAENHSDSTSYLLERNNIAFEPISAPGVESPEALADSSLAEHSRIHAPMNAWAQTAGIVQRLPVTSASALFAGAGVLLVYKDIAGGKKEGVFRHNLVEKELMDRTLRPGARMSGFVYIRTPTSSIKDYAACRIALKNLRTNEAVVFRFRLSEGGK